MRRITELLHTKVYTKDNNCLGRVFNIKLHPLYKGNALDHIEIVSLLYGQKSFWERLGLVESHPKEVAWKDVVAVERKKIVIRDKKN